MDTSRSAIRHRRAPLATLVIVALSTALLAPAVAAEPGKAGFKTARAPMLSPVVAGSEVQAIISVGDTLGGGYRFEAIPDGVAIWPRGNGRVDVYVNHETSTVPFPYGPTSSPPVPPTAANSKNDFDNAQLSRLIINQHSMGVLNGDLVIPSSANYQRFCSNFIASSAEGFDRPILFTNEEATDTVNRVGTAWPATAAFGSQPEQAGVVVAYDLRTGAYRSIYGMGRHNHENSVAIPGYEELVLLSGDDTFSAPASQLYSYIAADTDAVWNDDGHLWAFQATTPAGSPPINDYHDISGSASASGVFIPVPDIVADGGQSGLESWSNANNVFQFIRVEDIAYDRNDPHIVYFADTGEPRAIVDPADPVAGRLKRGASGTTGPFPNGRIWKMVLDETDPRVVTSLSVLWDADAGGYGNAAAMHNPDNVETTGTSLLVQEDPGSHNNGPAFSTARIWRFDLTAPGSAPFVVAEVNQSQHPTASHGSWESSGIVDVSSVFGPGTFLVTVQAHTLFTDTAPGPDLLDPVGADWTYKREDGQLLLLTIPGA